MEHTRKHVSLREVYGYEDGWGVPGPEIAAEITRIMVESEDGRPAEEQVVQHEQLPEDDAADTTTQ